MSLTGGLFLGLLVLAAVAGFMGLVVAWPRLAGSGPLPLGLRAGALVALNALVLTTAAAALNDQFLFYANWGDLRGVKQTVLAQSQSGASVADALRAAQGTVHVAKLASLPPLPRGVSVRRREFAVQVTGPSGVRGEVRVALPAAYFDTHQRDRRFPVIEAFQGVPGTDRQWLRTMSLPARVRAQAAAGAMGDAIVVSPATMIPSSRDTECVDGPRRGTWYGEWLGSDVPSWVVQHLRVEPQRSGWATIGLSAGAWCAASITMTHPQRFGAALVIAGYFAPEFSNWRPYPPGSPALTQLDLVRMAAYAPPPVAVWVQTSKGDGLSLRSTLAFARSARPPLSVTLVELRQGGHRISVFKSRLPAALQWLGRELPGFAPVRFGTAPVPSAAAVVTAARGARRR